MSKNVLIISTSPRAGSNSELLSGEFGRGAKDSGNEVEIVSLKDKDIKFCRGCFACQKTQRYTRLGRITDKTSDELAGMLGNSDVVLRFEVN